MSKVSLYVGKNLGEYGFPGGHPFGPDRMQAFWCEAKRQGLDKRVLQKEPRQANRDELERFHTAEYVQRVKQASELGTGLLDHGDTPAFPGCFEAASTVVGSTLDALSQIMNKKVQRSFVPIAGLHHARRDSAEGFCIFNDCGVVIETLRKKYGVQRIAYVDIDAHHGDGVFYSFDDDPEVFVADIHEDGHFIYPGTGSADETGAGKAKGTKRNIPLSPGAGDAEFHQVWPQVVAFLEKAKPSFVLFQCGADSVEGDPLTHLRFSPAVHAQAARDLVQLAKKFGEGRLLAVGGGGYNNNNLAKAWTGVVSELLKVD
ncbi:MAG: acetoin utilization protein AcuC [Pseudomonadota bacterium]